MDHGCSGQCGGCNGCGQSLTLTQKEIDFLYKLGQIPFLPVARKADGETGVFLEEAGWDTVIALLERKGLVSLDYDKPIQGFDYSAYAGYPLRGSMALTARGIGALELLDIRGAD